MSLFVSLFLARGRHVASSVYSGYNQQLYNALCFEPISYLLDPESAAAAKKLEEEKKKKPIPEIKEPVDEGNQSQQKQKSASNDKNQKKAPTKDPKSKSNVDPAQSGTDSSKRTQRQYKKKPTTILEMGKSSISHEWGEVDHVQVQKLATLI